MAWLSRSIVYGVECDAIDCDAELVAAGDRGEVADASRAAGWTFRNRHWWCPDHATTNRCRHTMHLWG